MEARWVKYILRFDKKRGTSRGWLTEKPSWFIILRDQDKLGIGECGMLPGLSVDDKDNYEQKLDEVIGAWNAQEEIPNLTEWPSINFGLEMAQKHLRQGKLASLFKTDFTRKNKGIEINGLVWMGTKKVMLEELTSKIESGFNCIKIKIGAIDFEEELSLLKYIRDHFNASQITIRVDANGAFAASEALERLKILSEFDLHSIEQPIKAGQWEELARLCELSPLAIALDEELIGIYHKKERRKLLEMIKPQAIVLKPSLVGGFRDCKEWIELAAEKDAFWWITSALESNLGLNAIAQFTASQNPKIPQGLGTGGLYLNNIESPLNIAKNKLYYDSQIKWHLPFLNETLE